MTKVDETSVKRERVDIGAAGCGCVVTVLMTVYSGGNYHHYYSNEVEGTEHTEHHDRCWDNRRITDVEDGRVEALREYAHRHPYEVVGLREPSDWVSELLAKPSALGTPTGNDECGCPMHGGRTEHLDICPSDMLGERVSVEHVGLPAPDAHAVAAHTVSLDTRLALGRVLVEFQRGHTDATGAIDAILTLFQPSPAAYTPWLTLSGAEIEHLLCDHAGVMLQAQDTKDEETAHPLTVGECDGDGDGCDAELPDEEPVPFVSAEGPRAGYVAGHCGHAVAESEWRAGFRNCERCHFAPLHDRKPEGERHGGEGLPNAPKCVLLISDAFGGGVLHLPSGERTAIRIGAEA